MMAERYETPRERVLAAVHALADADESDPDEWRAVWERFRAAATHWLEGTAGGRGRVRASFRTQRSRSGSGDCEA